MSDYDYPNFRANVARRYRDHVRRVLGMVVPDVASGEELIALAKQIVNPPCEAEHGWRTDPPFPGVAGVPEKSHTGWHMLCVSRVHDTKNNNEEMGVLFMTLYSGRPTTVVVSARGTYVPEDYVPIAQR